MNNYMNSKNHSFEKDIKEMGDIVKEIIHSKSFDDAKNSASKLGEKFSDLSSLSKDKVGEARDKTQEMIQDRPFTAVLIAVGAGALLGLLMRCRK